MEIKLKEMAVAIGAPMKPNPKGFGPHTVQRQLFQPHPGKEINENGDIPKR